MRWRNLLFEAWFRPVDGASLAIFRIGFGLVMLWECWRYVSHGWIARYYIRPEWNFPYLGFEWVQPWSGDGMYYHFACLALAALLVTLGLFYRLAATVLFVAFTYVFLLEEARYLNHFYLVSLLCAVLVVLPAHRRFSLDARFFSKKKSSAVPGWSVFLAQFMIAVPYFFGGVAKLNADWLQGQPIGMWLKERANFPWVGAVFSQPEAGYVFAYGGLFVDLLAPLFLWWPRTRPFFAILLLTFHTTNDRIFSIGIFPWFMVLATTLFFPPDWPKRLAQDLFVTPTRQGVGAIIFAAFVAFLIVAGGSEPSIVPFTGAFILIALLYWTGAERLRLRPDSVKWWSALGRAYEVESAHVGAAKPTPEIHPTPRQWAIVAALGGWIAIQTLVPLRHLAIPGAANWTEEGHRFSWHMKLRDKSASIQFYAVEPDTRRRWRIPYRKYLARWQARKMAKRPYMIRQFAHYLAERLEAEGHSNVEIYAESRARLNGRPYQTLIDPRVNLVATPASWWKADWILPLQTPLPSQ